MEGVPVTRFKGCVLWDCIPYSGIIEQAEVYQIWTYLESLKRMKIHKMIERHARRRIRQRNGESHVRGWSL